MARYKPPRKEYILPITPLEAIQQLRRLSNRVKLGRNFYLELIGLIRVLIRERADVQKQVDQLELRLYQLQQPKPPKPRVPFETEGTGQWG